MIGQEGAPPPGADSRREWFEVVLDLMPSPLLLIEPGSARLTFANRAAHRMAGGAYDGARYRCTDGRGRTLPDDELPGVRAANGERIDGFQMDWHTPAGVRSLIVSADTIPPTLGQPATVVCCFEDVGALKDAEERVRDQAVEIARLYRQTREAERRKDESLALLDTLFATAPIGLAFYDSELRYVRINEALAEMHGSNPADNIGHTPERAVPDVAPRVMAALRQVLETGEPIVDYPVSGEMPAAPGELRHWLASYYPVHDGNGHVLGIGAVVQETTERERLLEAEQAARRRAESAERRWAFLAEAGELLGSSLDYEETLRSLSRIVVPALADWYALDLLEPDGTIRRLHVTHHDPERERLGWELARWRSRLDDPAGIGAVIRTGIPEHYPAVPDELLVSVAQSEEHLALMRGAGFRSGIVVPLVSGDRPLGALSLVSDGDRRFGEDDVELAGELARRAAAAVENARLYRERSQIARTLQASLLPPHLPAVPGFEVAARYRPAAAGVDVGGDFYDLFERSSGRWSAVIGDVCGKGADAAALTALARHTVRAAAIHEASPSGVLALLNEAILRERTDDRFCTVAYATLHADGDAARAVVACGGHPLPLVLRAGGAVETVGCPGTLLGVHREPDLSDRAVELGQGDALVLFTDGVADSPSRDGVLAPEELAEIVAGAAGLDAQAIADRIEGPLAAISERGTRDDAALLVLRRSP